MISGSRTPAYSCKFNAILYGFFGIQIVQNSISAGAVPGPSWGAYDSPDSPVGWEGDTPPHSYPLDAFGTEAPNFCTLVAPMIGA